MMVPLYCENFNRVCCVCCTRSCMGGTGCMSAPRTDNMHVIGVVRSVDDGAATFTFDSRSLPQARHPREQEQPRSPKPRFRKR